MLMMKKMMLRKRKERMMKEDDDDEFGDQEGDGHAFDLKAHFCNRSVQVFLVPNPRQWPLFFSLGYRRLASLGRMQTSAAASEEEGGDRNGSIALEGPVDTSQQCWCCCSEPAEGEETGNSCLVCFSPIALLTAAGFCVSLFGLPAAFVFTMAVVPGMALLAWIRRGHEAALSLPVLAEFYWLGAFLSAAIAILLELPAAMIAARGLRCLPYSGGVAVGAYRLTLPPPSALCSAAVLTYMLLGVGLLEEFAKFFPLQRLRLVSHAPATKCRCWWRTATCQHGIVLAGCAAGAGFAAIENVKYSFIFGPDVRLDLVVTATRALTAVPFHMCATGLAAARLAAYSYSETRSGGQAAPRATSRVAVADANENSQRAQGPDPTSLLASYHTGEGPPPARRWWSASPLRCLNFLGISIVCHGLYDGCLKLSEAYAVAAFFPVAFAFAALGFGAWLFLILSFLNAYRKLPPSTPLLPPGAPSVHTPRDARDAHAAAQP
eukprot:GHVT01097653.1.p1 GENE.GHVT01097653.1~~GHVT01097653.1.p1  ORF type:complete len:492 (+),score=98.00 GHVT01097653.1:3-1478(+)